MRVHPNFKILSSTALLPDYLVNADIVRHPELYPFQIQTQLWNKAQEVGQAVIKEKASSEIEAYLAEARPKFHDALKNEIITYVLFIKSYLAEDADTVKFSAAGDDAQKYVSDKICQMYKHHYVLGGKENEEFLNTIDTGLNLFSCGVEKIKRGKEVFFQFVSNARKRSRFDSFVFLVFHREFQNSYELSSFLEIPFEESDETLSEYWEEVLLGMLIETEAWFSIALEEKIENALNEINPKIKARIYEENKILIDSVNKLHYVSYCEEYFYRNLQNYISNVQNSESIEKLFENSLGFLNHVRSHFRDEAILSGLSEDRLKLIIIVRLLSLALNDFRKNTNADFAMVHARQDIEATVQDIEPSAEEKSTGSVIAFFSKKLSQVKQEVEVAKIGFLAQMNPISSEDKDFSNWISRDLTSTNKDANLCDFLKLLFLRNLSFKKGYLRNALEKWKIVDSNGELDVFVKKLIGLNPTHKFKP